VLKGGWLDSAIGWKETRREETDDLLMTPTKCASEVQKHGASRGSSRPRKFASFFKFFLSVSFAGRWRRADPMEKKVALPVRRLSSIDTLL